MTVGYMCISKALGLGSEAREHVSLKLFSLILEA